MRRNCPEPVTTTKNNLSQTFCRILDWYFSNYYYNEAHIVASEEIDEIIDTIECLLWYATVWSFGWTTNFEGRKKFDSKMREVLGGYSGTSPREGLVHDIWYDNKNKIWTDWYDTILSYQIYTKINYTDIVVPTFD